MRGCCRTLALLAVLLPVPLAAQTPILVRDIDTAPASSRPTALRAVGSRVFFIAQDAPGLYALWVSDGTAPGTVRLADYAVISGSVDAAQNSSLTAVGERLFFAAQGASGAIELWRSDGTPAGTIKITDTLSLAYSPAPIAEMVDFGGTAFFTSRGPSGADNVALWKSDGTAAGTVMVADPHPGPEFAAVQHLTVVGATLYFTTRWSGPPELWRSDGTPVGTTLVTAVPDTVSGEGIGETASVGTTLVFTVGDSVHGVEPWVSDGTAAGTMLLADLRPGTASSFPYKLTTVGRRLFFFADDGSIGLFSTDGTGPGTGKVTALPQTPSAFDDVAAGIGRLFFTLNDGALLWTSDGTAGGTVQLLSGATDYTANLAVAGGRVFLNNSGPSFAGKELWSSDGTPAGTMRVADIAPGFASSSPAELTTVGTNVFFSATGGAGDRELWRSDGTAAGTVELDVAPGTADASPRDFVAVGSRLFFVVPEAPPPAAGNDDLWSSDGTAAGTQFLAATASYLAPLGSRLYFSAPGGLWASTGTPAGTASVAGSPGDVRGKLAVGSKLALGVGVDDVAVHDPADGSFTTLAHIAGAIACTPMHCVDIGSYPSGFRTLGGTLYFLAASGTYGFSLWRSDLTPGGTARVRTLELDPRYGFNPPWDRYEFVASGVRGGCQGGGRLFFPNSDTAGNELWASDGTSAGTQPVADINPGSAGSDPSFLTDVGGTLFLTADDGSSGRELWKSDGTPAGTVRLGDLRPGPAGSDPRSFAAAGGVLYFSADDGTNGRELWRSNGTAAGTILIADLNPGPASSDPTGFRAVNRLVYFEANDGTHGAELWQTDGSVAGTVRVTDLYPGTGGSHPAELTDVGGQLFFAAFSPATGRELWRLGGGCR